MEGDDQRFVLGTDGPDEHARARAGLPGRRILDWIRANGRTGELVFGGIGLLQHDARVERDEAIGGSEQRVDVDLFDPALLDDQLAEADDESIEGIEVDGFAAAHAFERGEDLRLLHLMAGERGGERRQRQGAIFPDLDELAAGSKQENGAELRIDAAAKDEFVTFEFGEGLHRDAEKVLRADFFADGLLNVGEGSGDFAGVAQVELHAANVGFVGDGFGVELEDDGVSDLRGFGNRFAGGFRQLGANGRNAVGGEELLRLVFGEDGAASGADLADDAVGEVAFGIED